MKPSKIIENLTINDISAEGMSVGRNDDLVVFVKGGAPGDVVDVRIIGKQKKFLIGEPIKFHQRSKLREEAFCEHFGTCGGCKWQHLSYEAQLTYKQSHVEENLKKISGLNLPKVDPILGSEKQRYYRNKLEYTFSNKRWLTRENIDSGEKFEMDGLGFHIPRMFDKVLDIKQCYLQQDPSNEIRLAIRAYALKEKLSFYDIREQTGLLRNLIIRITSTGEVMVIVQFGENDMKSIHGLMGFMKEKFSGIASLNYIINLKKNETYYDLDVICYHGKEYIEERMEDLSFRIRPKSFFQTNSLQAGLLYHKAKQLADFKGDELVYDLYTGTGTIANYIASSVKAVIGIESVEEAVEDARINSEINGIENCTFFSGDMKDMLTKDFIDRHGKPDVVITDPPRAGMHNNVVLALNDMRPDKIVYVSCNPATQARDIAELGNNYEIVRIQPLDMFPHTHHVENIILLKLLDHAKRS